MNINQLVKTLGDCCYVFLALNFLWGLYCVVLISRRLKELRFRKLEQETAFVNQLQQHLQAKDYAAAATFCSPFAV